MGRLVGSMDTLPIVNVTEGMSAVTIYIEALKELGRYQRRSDLIIASLESSEDRNSTTLWLALSC